MTEVEHDATPRRGLDPRAAETRRRLVEAFVALSAAHAGNVTVPQIVARARLHRSSFYAHFGTVDELALYAIDRNLDQVHTENLGRHNRRTMPARASNTLVIAEILDRVSDPANPLMAVLARDRALGEQALGAQLSSRVLDYYAQVSSFGGLTPLTRSASAEYVGHGLAAVICGWLLGEVSMTRAELVDWLALLVPDWVMTAVPVTSVESRG
ncbi:TetR/AcrR family transcriptional regulator [Microlunatus ginsengisoli]|uniref:HTH tetR-type domain-containing protein n=1 Tax=Microlunatus ginsengisoli TaxID=363863 RepID=A0ABP6ZDU3_9ACTN